MSVQVEISDSNLKAYLKFNETSGSALADSSQYNNDGVLTTGTLVAGIEGNALDFNGASGNALIGDASNIHDVFSGGGSVAFYISPDSDGENDLGHIVAKANGYFVYLSSESGGKTFLTFEKTFSGNDGTWRTTAREINLSQWTQVVISYNQDAVGNDPIIYINNQSVAITESITPTGTASSDAGNALYIGNVSADNRTFDGKIDEFRLYSTLLTAEDVSHLFRSGLGLRKSVTRYVARNSVQWNNILTRQIDTLEFTLLYDGVSRTFRPAVGAEVAMYNDSTKIFAGNITKVTSDSQVNNMLEVKVHAVDFGRKLDRYLINDTFENQTVQQIIDFIIDDKGLDQEGFTANNVEGTTLIAYAGFRYEPFSDVLTYLADLIGFDWYIDVDKDIHFFSKTTNPAPVIVEDDTGTYLQGSMSIREDSSQVKNVIYVRGGEFLGSTITADYISDGIQNVYPLPYKYDDIRVSVTGSVWTGGIDNQDNIAQFDYLWNSDEKFIRFRGDRIPSDTSQFFVSGQPFLPVIVKYKDNDSIAMFSALEGGTGEYEYLIIDKSINSREGARERAAAEINSYAESITEVEFETYTDGFRAGQSVVIDSNLFGLDSEEYIINRVTGTMFTSGEMKYKLSLVTTRTFGIIDFLRNLLQGENKKIVIDENEIIDVIESYNETITVGETVTSDLEHNPQSETMTMSETFTAESLNYEPVWVLADFTPIMGGSVGYSDLVSWWKFDERIGTVVNDSVGNNDGSSTGSPLYVEGVKGEWALRFDAVNDYVEVPDSADLSFTDNQITISLWFRCSPQTLTADDRHYFLTKGGDGGAFEYATFIRSDGQIEGVLWQSAGANVANLGYTPGVRYDDGAWHHLAVTSDGVTIAMYIDGNLKNSNTSFSGTMSNTATKLYFGKRGDTAQLYAGDIDDARIYGTGLTQSDILEIYATHKREFSLDVSSFLY